MRRLRNYGTQRPHDFSAKLRQGVVLLAALLLACTLMAGAVSAEEVTVTTWSDLQTKFSGGNTITLGADIEIQGPLTLTSGEVTLNLGNHKLYNSTGNAASYPITINGGTLIITGTGSIEYPTDLIQLSKGTVNIQSGTLIANGGGAAVVITGSTESNAKDYSNLIVGKDATLKGGWYVVFISAKTTEKKFYGITIDIAGKLLSCENPANGGALYINGVLQKENTQTNPPVITIRDTAVIAPSKGNAVYAAGYGKWIIEGGTFTGTEALSIKSGEWDIKGGTFTGNGPFYDPAIYNGNGSEETGAAVSITTNHGYAKNVRITITGGTFTSEKQSAFYEGSSWKKDGDFQSGSALKQVLITGGTFETKNETLSAIRIQNSGDTTNITKGISIKDAPNGNTLLYPGLNQTGVEWDGDATNGYTLKITEGGSYKLMESFKYAPYTDKNRLSIVTGVTLDLNGKTITAERDSGNAGDTAFISVNGKELTINGNGGGITTSGASSDGYKSCLFFAGKNTKLTINSGTFQSNGIVIAENAEVKDGQPLYAAPKTTLNGGTFTSTDSTAIYMTADNGELTVADGVQITGKTAGIEIRSGTANLNGGKITATGANTYPAYAAVPSNPITDGSAIVLVSKAGAYTAAIDLNIAGTTEITSTNGAAIRNYVRKGDGKGSMTADNATIKVIVSDTPKLAGAVAAIENAHYAGDTGATIVGTFALNGGYYKAPSYAELLVGNPAVTYQTGYSMSTEPVQDGYYAPTKTTAPEVKETVTPGSGGTVVITPPVSGSLVVEDKTVTITAAGTSGSDNSVTLKVTYEDGATVADTGASGKVASVEAEYKAIPLEDTTSGVTGAKVDMTITLTTVDTNLPTITGKLSDAKQTALQAFGSTYTTFKMGPAFVASHEKLAEFNNNVSTITLTFLVPKSWAPESGNIGVVHISDDANPVVTKSGLTVVTTDDGENWKVTVTSTKKFSGYSTYYAESSSPGPGPQPTYQPVSSSGSGNMENAFRVLFDTQGGSFISPSTGLSYGDKISQPPAPTKDGYTFGGWYKDEACTQSWSFASGIDGDMTLYAKWTPSSGGSSQTVSQTGSATAQQTVKATPAATQAQSTSAATPAPSGTSASGVSPTMTQAPAPVLGALLGLLAAGVLIRRRD
ncbi:InlB B-repeat-containing protein [Methanocorpusculum vombati]|uniref:InlB B-repeat-containing protein n=1 Tax=Methanocorpusculum vombati TaxID=3002864 RepID=A0ABT4ILK5_9EURY|nr:InlB B-repeat-containing protein [Methanocorpusculum vombati]MCZ9320270.1 InlB B-repeat-containing protein [Methanocorpusculum sp.]MCZ0862649.1 InlB B-repeat-containing protein [Methanocorpusculum vombati]MDE2520786.1 InlB B-repeat-containing protein [Methanocorpusculum sp.]MDE2535138.1 InlB B-repeat-containing protein [Methanocorpusculum sp.]MDE2548054.1 InlB B-repeat-containing protein [Methanocorpusculum sp.]